MSQKVREPASSRVRGRIGIAGVVLFCAAAGGAAQTTSSSSAFGESVSLNLVPVLGQGIPIGSGPLPAVTGTAPPPYQQTASLPSTGAFSALTGSVLDTGSIAVHASSGVPATDTAAADATVNNLALNLVQLLPQLHLGADIVKSTAGFTGSCAAGLVASGTTTFTNGQLSGTLAGGNVSLSSAPAPNTVLLNSSLVRIVLNEQIPTATPGVQGLMVNAVHVTVNGLRLLGIGTLSGEAVIAQSHAEIHCAAPPSTADLGLTHQVSPNPVQKGGTLTYTLTVANAGPSAATQTVLTDPLPAGATLLSSHPSQGSCSGTSTLVCNLGTIAPGGQATLSVTARADVLGTLVDTATVASATIDPQPANNQATATAAVQGGDPSASADLAVTLSADAAVAQADQVVTYVISVANRGPSPATGVHLSQLVPDRCDAVSTRPGQGSCASDTSCDLGDLAVGQSATVTLELRLHQIGSNLLQTAATSTVADPDPSNNQAARTVTVQEPAGGGGGGGGGSCSCEVDAVPAATLLFPYFQVDLGRGDGVSTLLSITNAFAAPRLAEVTLWTSWGIPTLSFPVYLTGFDVQTLNLRDLLAAGRTPATGTNLSPTGAFSPDVTHFPGCPGAGAVAAALTPSEQAHLRAWHTGARSPLTDSCAASPSGNLAVGYVTVDVVRSCSALTPADPGYFGPGGVAADDNVLFGDFMFVDPAARSAKGDLAVHVVAEPGAYQAGDYTFYGRFVHGDASDHRRPLGTRYATRFLAGGNFAAKTELLVWRDTKAPAPQEGLPCGQTPPGLPLAQGGVTLFDEQEKAAALPPSTERLPLAVQVLPVGDAGLPVPGPFGWLMLDLGHGDVADLFGGVAQGWVTTLITADGRFTSIAQRAVRLGCTRP